MGAESPTFRKSDFDESLDNNCVLFFDVVTNEGLSGKKKCSGTATDSKTIWTAYHCTNPIENVDSSGKPIPGVPTFKEQKLNTIACGKKTAEALCNRNRPDFLECLSRSFRFIYQAENGYKTKTPDFKHAQAFIEEVNFPIKKNSNYSSETFFSLSLFTDFSKIELQSELSPVEGKSKIPKIRIAKIGSTVYETCQIQGLGSGNPNSTSIQPSEIQLYSHTALVANATDENGKTKTVAVENGHTYPTLGSNYIRINRRFESGSSGSGLLCRGKDQPWELLGILSQAGVAEFTDISAVFGNDFQRFIKD
jgi:hypothetical protein